MLTARDGHEFSIYSAEPGTNNTAEPDNTAPGLVVLQEIFGITGHIREVCDGFAARGYRVVAPALFDRVQRDMDLDYGPKGFKVGAGLRRLIPLEYSMMDIAACIEHLRGPAGGGPAGGGPAGDQSGGEGGGPAKVGCVGYCWGGTLAWVSAQRFDLDAAVGYYGGAIAEYLEGDLYCPVLLHFGEDDKAIPPDDVARIRAAYPQAQVHTYEGAGHGFNRDAGAAHTRLALERTLGILASNLGGRPGA